jgi:fructose-1-phosphate kinase PfkB-like protein
VSVGGKGQHFAIAANRLGQGSAAVAHLLGRRGEEGEQVRHALERLGVAQEVEWHHGATRTCTTILEDGGRMTELIEPSDPIPQAAVDALLARLRARLRLHLCVPARVHYSVDNRWCFRDDHCDDHCACSTTEPIFFLCMTGHG